MDSHNEAVRLIQYFWTEYHDIERYSGWEEVKEKFSKIAFAMSQVEIWKEMLDNLVDKLEEKYDCEKCGQEDCICYQEDKMAEQDKCPFCNTGNVLWIYESPMIDEIYALKCSFCDAYGEFKKETKHTEYAEGEHDYNQEILWKLKHIALGV